MAGNIFLGTTLATLKETFSWTVFWNGVAKAAFVAAGCCLMYLASWLNPDILVATIAGNEVNLIGGMELIFTAGIALYGVECLIKLKDMLGVKINVGEAKVAENATQGVTSEQAFNSAAIINPNEDIVQDGVRAEGSI